jgi:hypothetical protein
MFRLINAVALGGGLLMVATAPAAFAQHEHHVWCLQGGDGSTECAYDTLAQCRASKASGQGRCVRNTPASNH